MKQRKAVETCYNQTADQYAEKFFQELDHKPMDRLLLQRFVDDNQGEIADLGCGPGQSTVYLDKLGAKELVGIDLSESMIATATKLTKGAIEFAVGDMTKLDYPDNHFAGVTAFYAIVHFEIDELDTPFNEIYRVLEKGGQFMFSFHAGEGKNSLTDFLGETVMVDFHYFDPDVIIQKLEAIGFVIKDALVRYPYTVVEYPTKRGYIIAEKG